MRIAVLHLYDKYNNTTMSLGINTDIYNITNGVRYVVYMNKKYINVDIKLISISYIDTILWDEKFNEIFDIMFDDIIFKNILNSEKNTCE